jgi:hypothetical protein
MHHAKTLLIVIATVAALSGCTTSYRTTLEQKLENKSPDAKRAVLVQECGTEIAKGMKKDDPANMHHFENMKKICEEMTGQKIKTEKP